MHKASADGSPKPSPIIHLLCVGRLFGMTDGRMVTGKMNPIMKCGWFCPWLLFSARLNWMRRRGSQWSVIDAAIEIHHPSGREATAVCGDGDSPGWWVVGVYVGHYRKFRTPWPHLVNPRMLFRARYKGMMLMTWTVDWKGRNEVLFLMTRQDLIDLHIRHLLPPPSTHQPPSTHPPTPPVHPIPVVRRINSLLLTICSICFNPKVITIL